MTRIATVEAIPEPGRALVAVARETACGHDCSTCGGCGAAPGSITVRAETLVEVAPGDRVELSSSNIVLGYAALVYLGPVVLALAGFLLPFSAGVRYVCGGIGFALGIALMVLCDRRARKKRSIRYYVVRKL